MEDKESLSRLESLLSIFYCYARRYFARTSWINFFVSFLRNVFDPFPCRFSFLNAIFIYPTVPAERTKETFVVCR